MPKFDRTTVTALDRSQRQVTRGELADLRRKQAIMQLWEAGMTQRELAERMTKSSVAEGGDPVTENSVFKLIRRIRRNGDTVTA